MFAFFNNVDEATMEIARSDTAWAAYEQQKQEHDQQVAQLTRQYNSARDALQGEIERWLTDVASQIAAEEDQPLQFEVAQVVESTTASKARLEPQPDHSLLATGPVGDKDKYTLVIPAPKLPLTGLRVEALAHKSLGGNGPGRTAHGNFVLTQLRVHASTDRTFKEHRSIDFLSADADFAQQNFAPATALTKDAKTGWAISPQMGKDHSITFYTAQPQTFAAGQYLQIVLDQQYGGQHTLGHLRVSTMTGFDPLRALPSAVATAVKTPADRRTESQRLAIADHVASLQAPTAKLAEQLETLRSQAPQPPLMTVSILKLAARDTHRLHRGDFLQPGESVVASALPVIQETHPLVPRDPNATPDRLDLARWLVDPQHPLTARVIVNQVWAHLFGRGIVPTLNDFGVRGERPTHPQLLDWLAWHFPRDMQWSRKALIKSIVMSAAYRQSSAHRPELVERDPTNLLLARQNRVRVEAEIVRDLYLAVSGLLSDKVGGPSVFPPLPPGVAELSYANNFKWKTSAGEDRYRRGMYTFFKRTSPHPTLISFDCPDSNTTRLAREVSNTPLQALTTLNNDVFAEAAAAMAQRVLTFPRQRIASTKPSASEPSEDTQRLTYALQLCLTRPPRSEEVAQFQQLLGAARDYYQQHPDDAQALTESMRRRA